MVPKAIKWPAKDGDEIRVVRVVFYTANTVHKTGEALVHLVSFTCSAKNISPSWKVLFPVLRTYLARSRCRDSSIYSHSTLNITEAKYTISKVERNHRSFSGL